MQIIYCDIPDVKLLVPEKHEDSRGYFIETFNKKFLDIDFVQDNYSVSLLKHTIRGLHFQVSPSAQGKLVRVVQGSILDVAVDIRMSSAYFGQYVSQLLSKVGRQQLYIPQGFAHGFCTLEDNTEVAYKVSNYYCREDERGIFWNDPFINIKWPTKDPILSDRDQNLTEFKNHYDCSYEDYFSYRDI